MSKVIQLMTRMFEKLKDKKSSHSGETLNMLVDAIGKFGPIQEYYNLLLTPLSQMLQR